MLTLKQWLYSFK